MGMVALSGPLDAICMAWALGACCIEQRGVSGKDQRPDGGVVTTCTQYLHRAGVPSAILPADRAPGGHALKHATHRTMQLLTK